MLTLHLINIAVFIGFIFLTWKKPGIALVTLLPTAVGMFLSGLIYFDGEIVDAGLLISLLPVLLLPITICIIHWGPSSSELERPWYKAVTSMILAFLKYILILSVFVGVFQFFSPILFVLFLISVYQFAQARKFGLTMDVITAIGTSMRQSLPLPMALTTAAHGQKQREARIFNNIAHWLTQGWPLSEAMRRGYPRCPSNILASIASAEKMNQLPKAIESLNADLSEKINKCKIPQHVNLFYPFVVLTFMFSIMIGLSIFIVPTFAEVLWEMSEGKGALPAATQLLLELAKWILGRQGLNALTVVAIPSVIIFFSMYIKFRRRHPSNPGFISRIGDWIKWHTPVWHWFEKTFSNLYLVQIFHV
ncbi:MAG: type II secretion system F family protein, partial [Anaerohalosphaera sp.]|nr:type II secretion system F family protein [Anaerohalosphaera sp.]